MKESGESIMRVASTLVVVVFIAVRPASGQENNAAADIRAGHQLAAMLCGSCHVAAPDQAFMPILDPPAPSFDSIARRKDLTADWLRNFLTTTHRGLDKPKGMPDPYLADYQVKEVVAYLMSLRKQ